MNDQRSINKAAMLLAAIVLAGALAGCGGDTSSDESAPEDEVAQEAVAPGDIRNGART